ncbi:MAG: hypothetical protein JOY94_02020 [Methylobacteriaceae bacterium]|nr:hypothetical protein [Methylobacteriaceae bacterium]
MSTGRQSNGKSQLSAKADRLNSGAQLFLISKPTSIQLCVRGFVDDGRRDLLYTCCRICNVSLVEHTGFEWAVVSAKGRGQQEYPNSLKFPDNAGIVQGTVVLHEKQRMLDAWQVLWGAPTPDPESIDVPTGRPPQLQA